METTEKIEEQRIRVEDPAAEDVQAEEDALQPLISLASALLDTDRVLIVAQLVKGPANRMEMAEATGLSHRELLRHLGLLQYFGLVKLADAGVHNPDHYTRYMLDEEAFRRAREALGKQKGRKARPTDLRAMTLETFMPGGKLTAFPRKHEQIRMVLDEIAGHFETGREYKEADVNVILEEINEDYCTIRRHLVDFGYLSRKSGVYKKKF